MRDLFICILTALIVVVQCETIHFTNSPSHLVGSRNITSYKLLVKNSDPITIIEANKEIEERPRTRPYENFNYNPNDRIDIDVDESGDLPLRDYHVKLLANLGGSHQVEPAKTQDFRGAVGLTIVGGPTSLPTTNLNDFKKTSQDNDGESSNVSAKKVVYSPILLKKFMKEYSEKLKNADSSTKNEIQRIHEKIYEHQQSSDENKHETSEPPLEFDKSIEEIEQKYNYNAFHDKYDDDRRKRPSDPYLDKDGWVTLEAVPWSSSSISKWYPHGSEDETRRRPTGGRPYDKKPEKFPYQDDFGDDYYNRPKPGYVDRDRPSHSSIYSGWTKPQAMNSNGRPKPQPYRFGESFGSHKFHDRDHQSNRPWNSDGDIITDNRPSSFPSESHSSHSSHYHDDDHYNTASSNFHSSYQERPNEGNGEWVLISTTKGYQMSSGNRRQQDIKRKPTTTIHGGMVEIDATHDSIDDDVRATLLAQKKVTTMNVNNPVKTSSTENKNRKLLKVITTKNGYDKSTEIIAAVGAGLVPATMAFLAPMILGRKRRSADTTTTEHYKPYQQQSTYNSIHQPFM